jgi:hypothetical protein
MIEPNDRSLGRSLRRPVQQPAEMGFALSDLPAETISGSLVLSNHYPKRKKKERIERAYDRLPLRLLRRGRWVNTASATRMGTLLCVLIYASFNDIFQSNNVGLDVIGFWS